MTDCLEHSVLSGDGCQRGLVPIASRPNPAVEAFFDSACAAKTLDSAARRTATFTGRLRLSQESQRAVNMLDIESLENTDVSATPDVRGHPNR
jgi:hypothetical protein